MAYGTYAPFYRPGYFNPMPTMPFPDNSNQQMNQPYQPPMQPTQAPVSNQAANDMLWVLNENEATSYPVALGATVTLWDKNEPTIYIKSVNAQGVPSMRILDFTERTQNAPNLPVERVNQDNNNFVHMDEFKALQAKFEDLTAKFENFSTNATEMKGDNSNA